MAAEADVRLNEEDVVVMTLGPLLVFDWRGPPTEQLVAKVGTHLLAFARAQPAGYAMLAYVREGATFPSNSCRALMEDLLKQAGANKQLRVAVIEGEGIRRPLLRAFFSGLNTVLGNSSNYAGGATLDAVAWPLAQRMEALDPASGWTAETLVRVLQDARVAYDQAAA